MLKQGSYIEKLNLERKNLIPFALDICHIAIAVIEYSIVIVKAYTLW
jgi:hypothetical protein